jgi:L-aspartate oxidase
MMPAGIAEMSIRSPGNTKGRIIPTSGRRRQRIEGPGPMPEQQTSDVLVIGSGAAGLSLALRLADRMDVTVINKGRLPESNSYYAQGGMSAVLGDDDSLDSHVQDTLEAGAGLCHPSTVRFVVEHGPVAVDWLRALGVHFTRTEAGDETSPYHLTKEGGHSHRRVVHVADATGQAMSDALVAAATAHPRIRMLESHLAVDLITGRKHGLDHDRCLGAYVLDLESQKVCVHRARAVVLASGGAGKVYLYTSNPDLATGDGIAMAWRAGCRVANMEFIQFHPTCLYHPDAKSFLVTEALRGEGARLRLPDGTAFMEAFDSRAELAPRDIVARAIDHEMKRLGIDCVYLDISHQSGDFIRSHFPTVHARCLALGFDLAREPIPVVPAAHYVCGGVMSDLQGRTDIEGLYAIGEVAFTGLHGANRMASNSLLECMVFAESASESIGAHLGEWPLPQPVAEWDESRVTGSDEEVVVSHNWDELRRFMWDYVGIVRTSKRLQRAQRRARLLLSEIDEYYGNFRVTNDLIELRNLAVVGNLIIESALARHESRGLHYTLDYPEPNREGTPSDTILMPRL